jgi:hypothetical protein
MLEFFDFCHFISTVRNVQKPSYKRPSKEILLIFPPARPLVTDVTDVTLAPASVTSVTG